MIPMSLGDIAGAVNGASIAPDRDRVVQRVVTDSREVQAGDLFVAIVGARMDGHRFTDAAWARGAAGCLVSKYTHGAVPANGPRIVVKDTIAALNKLASHYRRWVMPSTTKVVAITGSNGKTTTKFMLDHVLKAKLPGRAAPASFNNHLGVPLTILSTQETDRYLIVEIGSNARGEVAALAAVAAPDVGVITSIGEAHLEGFGSIEAIADEKSSLLEQVNPNGAAFVNVDRPEILPFLRRFQGGRLMRFGFGRDVDLRVTDPTGSIEHTAFELGGRFHVELPLPGRHHATNAAVVFGVARWFALDPKQIIESLASFQAAPGRADHRSIGGVNIIDDAYNANPTSMTAAIASLGRAVGGRRIMVMGDMLELGEAALPQHDRVIEQALASPIEKIIGVGNVMMQAAGLYGARAGGDRLLSFPSQEEAGHYLCSIVRAGDTVWIKGSRAMFLDRMVDALSAQLGETATATVST